MRTALNPKHNDWYEEMCALAAIGELSASEFEDLQAHLADCAACRELQADFRRIAADDLGRVAVSRSQREDSSESRGEIDERALLSRLLDRAEEQRLENISGTNAASTGHKESSPHLMFRYALDWLRRPALSYGVAGLLLCAIAGAGAYRLRETQLSPALVELRSEVSEWKNRAETNVREQEHTARQLSETQTERDALRKSLEDAQNRYAQLVNERTSLESDLASERSRLAQDEKDLSTAKAQADDKAKQVAALETRLRDATARTEEQKRIAEGLDAKLRQVQEQASNTPEVRGFGDVEAKELFGARDLHIVDVYDVDAKGATKRTYGRVYYVENKLLMFYAFDLDTKRRNRTPASFQAWGYQQPNASKPESLGLFSMDDPSVNRWVLRVNNPRVLERVDAVFVTAEVPNGSATPTGRRILYANLAGPANHP